MLLVSRSAGAVDDTSFVPPSVQDGKIEEFEFTGDGKTIITFFPGAFTETCTNEMNRIKAGIDDLRSFGAEVIGFSVDTPFSLKEFAEQNKLDFRLVSDREKQINESCGVMTSFHGFGFYGLAERAVFVVENGEVIHRQKVGPGETPVIALIKNEVAES